MVREVNEREDVPITIDYTDGSGNAVDPDDTGSDGVGDTLITITDPDDTDVISAVEMTHNSTGSFEYVWDTDVDGTGPGVYQIEMEAEFSGETKIVRDTITVN